MRMNEKKVRWVAVPAMGFAMSLAACLNSNETGTPTPSGTGTNASDSYVKEAQALKGKPGIDYDKAVKQLQSEHGIVPLTDLPENPLDPRIAAAMAKKSDAGKPTALRKSAAPYASGSYDVRRVFMQTVYLQDGENLEWHTYGGSSGVDPVMVLYRYGNQTPDFATTGAVSYNAQHLNEIYDYSDDFSGIHPMVNYTVPAGGAGYYAIMVFAYGNWTKGTTTLYKSQTPAGGSATTSTENISVTGHIVRYYGENLGNGYLYANATGSVYSDPWAFWWDFGNGWGGANDDYNGRNSYAALTGQFPASASYHGLNCMIFTGYNNEGTADWQHGQ